MHCNRSAPGFLYKSNCWLTFTTNEWQLLTELLLYKYQVRFQMPNRFNDYVSEDAIAALMEDAISETLSDETKKDLDDYLKSPNDF